MAGKKKKLHLINNNWSTWLEKLVNFVGLKSGNSGLNA